MYSTSSLKQPFSVRALFSRHFIHINIGMFCLLSIVVVWYIIQMSLTISRGYEVQEWGVAVKELSTHNARLEQETLNAQSLDRVAESVKMIGFVKSETPHYITSTVPALALAE